MNDARYAFRALQQNPAFALTAVVSIALAIGANATVFGIFDALIFRPLPVPRASRVVAVSSRSPSGTYEDVSWPDFVELRDKNRSFEGLIAAHLSPFGFAKDRQEQARMKGGCLVSGNLFKALHVEPILGRGFKPDEDQAPGRNAVLVLSHEFWANEFGGDQSVVGRQVILNGINFTVIGVAPESFTGLDQFFRPAFYIPAMMAPALNPTSADLLTNRGRRDFTVKGRLREGVSTAAARSEMMALAKSLEESFPATNRGVGATVRGEIQQRMESDVGDATASAFLFALGAVVLLIACANVANLMLNRGRARTRELAVRLAIGASRARIIRTLLMESLLISLAASALGVLIAQGGIGFVSSVKVPSDIPIDFNAQLDLRVVCFAIAAGVLSASIFGLIPAFRSTKTDLVPALKAGELDPRKERLFGRNALVVVQVAGSLVLLVGATQIFHALSALLSHSPGFQIEHRLLMSFDPSLVRYTPEQTAEFYRKLVDDARNTVGVRSAALAHFIPTSTNFESETVAPEGFEFPKGQRGEEIMSSTVGEGYFQTAGVSILRGRGFLRTDNAKSARVVVVNQHLADHFGIKDPIGKRVKLGDRTNEWAQIVGVTGTGKYISVMEPPLDFIYLPQSQHPLSYMTLMVETAGPATAAIEPLRKLALSIAPGLPIFGIRTFEDLYEQRSVKLAHVLTTVIAALGLIGLGLALVGLYAVVAYQVSRRTREIGIRMAIGATPGGVMKMVLKRAAVLGGIGVAIGLLVSIAAGQGLTFGLHVPAFDPVLFTATVIGLLLTTALAALIPARRAARIDPMGAMRQD